MSSPGCPGRTGLRPRSPPAQPGSCGSTVAHASTKASAPLSATTLPTNRINRSRTRRVRSGTSTLLGSTMTSPSTSSRNLRRRCSDTVTTWSNRCSSVDRWWRFLRPASLRIIVQDERDAREAPGERERDLGPVVHFHQIGRDLLQHRGDAGGVAPSGGEPPAGRCCVEGNVVERVIDRAADDLAARGAGQTVHTTDRSRRPAFGEKPSRGGKTVATRPYRPVS